MHSDENDSAVFKKAGNREEVTSPLSTKQKSKNCAIENRRLGLFKQCCRALNILYLNSPPYRLTLSPQCLGCAARTKPAPTLSSSRRTLSRFLLAGINGCLPSRCMRFRARTSGCELTGLPRGRGAYRTRYGLDRFDCVRLRHAPSMDWN